MALAVFSAAVEGVTDEAVLRRLVEIAGGTIGTVYGKKGKDFLHRKIAGFNSAARFSPWIVLIDLNAEAECAPALIESWLPNPAEKMCLRIAVHKIESWLLADRVNLAKFLKVSPSMLPQSPDMEQDPKKKLVGLACQSKSKDIRRDICPTLDSGRKVGPAYVSRLMEFVSIRWQPNDAADYSPSLNSCILAVNNIVKNINRS
jgi:hypothetical protein